MPSIGSSVGEGRGRAQRARVWGWVLVCSQICEFPRPEQACNCSTSPIYTHTDTPQRVRGWWGRGSQFMGRGFRPASLESGLFLKGTPRRLRCVAFAPTSQFSPYLHTRDSTQIHHSEYEVGGRRGGVTVHGTGFRPASLESGLFLQGTPRRLHCVTFAPTSQFSPYIHTRGSTQIHHSE